MENYFTGTGQKLRVHSKELCEGRYCPIHNPSDHPLKNAPTHWRGDRAIMERICEHGVGHPDEDELAFRIDVLKEDPEYAGIHGCDGCCHKETPN